MDKDSQNSTDENEEINLPDADFSELDEKADNLRTNEEIERLKAEVEDNKDKYIRALAELENFKKRALKERSDLLKYQGEKVLLDMLDIFDNLELALQYSEADPGKVKAGLELIYKSCVDTFAKWDVKAESGLDKEFDPAKHNAISKVQMEGKKSGVIINELKKAFFYKDKLLRPGEVVVAEEVKGGEKEGE